MPRDDYFPQDERGVLEGIGSEDGVVTSANLKPRGRRKTLAASPAWPAPCADAARWPTEARAWKEKEGGRGNPADAATASSLYATRQEEEPFEFRTDRKLTWTEPCRGTCMHTWTLRHGLTGNPSGTRECEL